MRRYIKPDDFFEQNITRIGIMAKKLGKGKRGVYSVIIRYVCIIARNLFSFLSQ